MKLGEHGGSYGTLF